MQIKDFEKLLQVLETVSALLQADELEERILDEVLNLVNGDQGSVLLYNPDNQNTSRTLIRQAPTEIVKLDHFLHEMLAGWVNFHKEPLLTDNITELLGEDEIDEKYRNITSAISVPLMLKGKLLGVLNLIRLKGKAAFGERELQMLNILAAMFARFIHNAKLHHHLFEETRRLQKEVQQKFAVHGIVGQSPPLQAVFALLEQVIPTDARVLIQGESGTGKELIARIIHYNGSRKEQPFVAIDCGAIPENLLEGELFGYIKGAFTGANQNKKGLFEAANGGTLFLDEIANMPPDIQSKFLRVLQQGEVRPLGSSEVRKVDVRIIAAGNINLQELVNSGQFRQDLFYRLNVLPVKLPPLRERKGDIAILANHFLQKLTEKYQRQIKGFEPDTVAFLEAYFWPGNVRELENIVERLVILCQNHLEYIPSTLLPVEIRPDVPAGEHLGTPSPGAERETDPGGIKSKLDAYEKTLLLEALVSSDWNQSAAARELKTTEHYVRNKMKKFALKRPG